METTTGKVRARRWIVFLAVAMLVFIGAVVVRHPPTIDPDGGFRLRPSHPVRQATDALESAIGGDDIVGIAVHRPGGVLDPKGLQALLEVEAAMQQVPQLRGIRAPHTAAVLGIVDGVVTAMTPLQPPPVDVAGWARARQLLAGSPFIRGALLSDDGELGLVLGWVDRGDTDHQVVRRAETWLQAAGSEEAAPVRNAVEGARLAVMLGDAPSPVDAEVVRRLLALPGPAGERARTWEEESRTDATRRDRGAVAAVEAKLAAMAQDGVELALVGPWALGAEIEREARRGLALLFASGLLAVVVLTGFRATDLALRLLLLAWIVVFTLFYWSWGTRPLDLPRMLWLALSPLLTLMVPEDRRGEPSDPFRPSAYAHWVLLLSFVLIAANAWVGTRSGFGRPQELLSSGSPAGRGAALMSAHLGPGPGWLVHRGKAGSALETPALREMEADAARIAMATGAEAPAGWPEFLASLGGGAGKASELTREARDQLLLLLGRPDDLSAFVDGPRGVAVSRIPWPSRLDAKNVQGAVAGGSVTLAGRRAEAELAASVRRGTLTLMAMFVLPFLAMDLARARRGWVGLSLIAASCVLIAGWPGPALLGPLLCAVLPAVAVGLRARLDVRRVLLAALILLVPAVSPLLPVRHLALGASLAFALAALFLGSRQAANARESSPGGHRVSLRIG